MPVVSFEDPQGFPNIDMTIEEGVKIYNENGTLVGTQALNCGEGKCTGRWTEYDNDMWCRSSIGYSLEIQLRDKNDNWSAPAVINIDGAVPSFY